MKRRTQPKARKARPGISKYQRKQASPGTLGHALIAAMNASPETKGARN